MGREKIPTSLELLGNLFLEIELGSYCFRRLLFDLFDRLSWRSLVHLPLIPINEIDFMSSYFSMVLKEFRFLVSSVIKLLHHLAIVSKDDLYFPGC